MSLENIPGQTRAKRFLKRLVRSGHIPHALLFSGMSGIGKEAVAREWAKVLNCESLLESLDCCDRCPSCRKIDSGNHPDVISVKSDGAFIKIDQVRGLRERLRFRPFESRWRVIVISGAQDLKDEAANSLLKLLEEPPGQNVFVLTVLESQMLLPTIVSRCCHLRFQPLEDPWIERYLIDTFEVEPSRARQVAALAEGSLDRAHWLAEEQHISRWKDILENLQRLDQLSAMDFFALMAQWVQKTDDLEQDLECIRFWIRDLTLARLDPEHPSMFELSEPTRNAAERVSVEVLFRLCELTEQAVQHLRLNANKLLTLEGVCLVIKDGLYGQGSWNSLS